MIKYVSGAYGFRILLRLHGSAAFKALTPALLSTAVYVAFSCVFPRLHEDDTQVFDHPYPLAALISAFSFMLTFKASFSYNRVSYVGKELVHSLLLLLLSYTRFWSLLIWICLSASLVLGSSYLCAHNAFKMARRRDGTGSISPSNEAVHEAP